MVDINEVAGLLHVEEKLRAHGNRYPHMLKAVQQALQNHETTHAPKPEPESEPTVEQTSQDETEVPKPEQPADNGNGMDRRI